MNWSPSCRAKPAANPASSPVLNRTAAGFRTALLHLLALWLAFSAYEVVSEMMVPQFVPTVAAIGLPLVLVTGAVGMLRVRCLLTRHLRALQADEEHRRSLEQSLQRSEQYYRSLIESQHDLIARLDQDGRFTFVNDAYRRLFGAESSADGQGFLGRRFVELVHADDLPLALESLQAVRTPPHRACVELRLDTVEGPRWFACETCGIVGPATGDVREIQTISRDITARKRAEEQLRHDVTHDALTGLPNRLLLLDRLGRCIQRLKRNPEALYAVLFLDLDHFKVINDSLGHSAGDELLATMASRLGTCLRGTDSIARPLDSSTIARLGGDEFVILLEDLREPANAEQVAQRIQETLSQPIRLANQDVYVAVSIGVAIGTPDYSEPADLIRDADTAMYRAKAAGRSRHQVFDKAMHQQAIHRLQIETDLRRAVEQKQLLLHYQPIVSLGTGEVVAFEALVRWQHPTHGLVPPDRFIPIAEETGLINPIGQWVISEACRQMGQWRRLMPPDRALSVSVNLSRRQLQDGQLLEHVDGALAQAGIAPSALNLEITESMVMEDGEAARPLLEALRRRGIHVHIDDFGTGHSSLSCLHRFPLDALKIDRAFIGNVAGNRDYAAIIHAIVALAHNLRAHVIAEGVETPEQVALLQGLDCDLAQGFHFFRPLPAADATALLLPTGQSGQVQAA